MDCDCLQSIIIPADLCSFVQCALKIRSGDADFALLSAEEALLLARENGTDMQVLGEVREKALASESSALSMVVLMRKEFSGNFNDLRGKRYCHPGVGISYRLSDHFLKYFERYMLHFDCKPWFSHVEEEISQISAFFGDSCRPGTWAQSRSLDKRLKGLYQNLCSLCDSKSKCTYNLDSSNSPEAALKCLTRNSGEVAYVPLEQVKKYFGLKDRTFKNNANDYVYLCKNQTTMEISAENPCVWGRQPWNVIVSRSDIATELKQLVANWLTADARVPGTAWLEHLQTLLIGSNKMYSFDRKELPSALRDYVDRGGVDVKGSTAECRNKVRWCTIGAIEHEKCNWLSLAAASYGLKPIISCHRGHTVHNCLNRISENKEDVISIYTEYGHIARSKYNLSTVVFEDNTLDGYYQIMAVLKAENTNIRTFRDLRNKKACFPEYNGLGWISFINIAKKYNLLGNTCPENFFGSSCVPGAFKSNLEVYGTSARPSSMCALCPQSNSSDPCPTYGNLVQKNRQALKCLSENGGDIAFVNFKALLSGVDVKTFDETINPSLFNVLCRNGTIAVGLATVDDNCALAEGINAEVVGRADFKKTVDNTDISELFLELNKAFGTVAIGEDNNIFKMFDPFKNEEVLFKDTSIGLVDIEENKYYDQINLYQSLLSNVTDSQCKGDAHRVIFARLSLLITFCAVFINSFM
ncbi:transferrin-like isoform X2 [Rhodnius prolixus]|uniref:transferrin-like isoform X2 n=1 Tax=Rhodnius prolixus TaxID=13249 RepID=UPI003D18BC7B